jgi:hypothetical protein
MPVLLQGSLLEGEPFSFIKRHSDAETVNLNRNFGFSVIINEAQRSHFIFFGILVGVCV